MPILEGSHDGLPLCEHARRRLLVVPMGQIVGKPGLSYTSPSAPLHLQGHICCYHLLVSFKAVGSALYIGRAQKMQKIATH